MLFETLELLLGPGRSLRSRTGDLKAMESLLKVSSRR